MPTPLLLSADDWKRLEATEDGARLPLEGAFSTGSQLQLRQASGNRGQDDLGLQFSKGCAQEKVNAESERDLPVLGSANVESVGIGELVWVTIGRAKDSGEVLSSFQCDPSNDDLLVHPPAR